MLKKEFNNVNYSVGRSASAMTDDDWDQSIAAALGAVATYAASIRNGSFEAEPANGCPRFCDYADICRYSGKSSD